MDNSEPKRGILFRCSFVKLSTLFAALLIGGVGGSLLYLRLATDRTLIVPFSGTNAAIISTSWCLAFIGWILFVVRLKYETRLQNLGAIAFLISALAIGGLGWATYAIHTQIPRGAVTNRFERFSEAVLIVDSELPKSVNADVTLVGVGFVRARLEYMYEVKPDYALDEMKLKDVARKAACTSLAYYFGRRFFDSVIYSYKSPYGGGYVSRLMFDVKARDCQGYRVP